MPSFLVPLNYAHDSFTHRFPMSVRWVMGVSGFCLRRTGNIWHQHYNDVQLIDSIGTGYLIHRALFLRSYRGPIIAIITRPRTAPPVPPDSPSTCRVPGSPRCNRASHSTCLVGSSFTKLIPSSITHLGIGRERLFIAISITLWTIGFDRLCMLPDQAVYLGNPSSSAYSTEHLTNDRAILRL